MDTEKQTQQSDHENDGSDSSIDSENSEPAEDSGDSMSPSSDDYDTHTNPRTTIDESHHRTTSTAVVWTDLIGSGKEGDRLLRTTHNHMDLTRHHGHSKSGVSRSVIEESYLTR